MKYLVLLFAIFSSTLAFSGWTKSLKMNGKEAGWRLLGPEYPEVDSSAKFCHSVSSLGNPNDPLSAPDKFGHFALFAATQFAVACALKTKDTSTAIVIASLHHTVVALVWEMYNRQGKTVVCSVPDLLADFVGIGAGSLAALTAIYMKTKLAGCCCSR